MAADIVLTTLNARYWHSAFGLRYLLANMGDLTQQTELLEFTINENLVDVLAQILRREPAIVGIGVYIWNVHEVEQLAAGIRRVAPQTIIVMGGPEVSYDTSTQRVAQLADYIITGEADLEFARLCRQLLDGQKPADRIVAAAPPAFDQLQLPYSLYTDEDIAHRVIYVEASRGCPFTCEFCLSALEIPVRQADVHEFLDALTQLMERGVRRFKFVDRTFNLNLKVSQRILTFFLEQGADDLFLHFEMIPDRLPESLRSLIAEFPAGSLQFEIGVQTFNNHTGQLISRRQDNAKLEDNFRFLRQQTGVHIHADLIVGLPGEDVESFGAGFDRLLALDPQEIQVGILKRLKGTPIVRHDGEYQMVYSDHPPFEILQTRDIDFAAMMRLRHFARAWDLVGNSGNFALSLPLMWRHGESPFTRLMEFTDQLVRQEGRLHGISLSRLMEAVFRFLQERCGLDPEAAAQAIWSDYTRIGRSDRPAFLRDFDLAAPQKRRSDHSDGLPVRQSRHQA